MSHHRFSFRNALFAWSLILLLTGCGEPADHDDSSSQPPSQRPSPAAASPPTATPAAATPTAATAPALSVTEAATTTPLSRDDVPEAMRACWNCHEETVRTYLGHAMASSAGPVDGPLAPPGGIPDGVVSQPATGDRYAISTERDGTTYLDTTFRDGGRRRQQLVGRIGAGRFDVSWAAAEVDEATGAVLGRLFFAPVELITGHGWALSPFELSPPSSGVDFALTTECLGCHVARDLSGLPGAATTETPSGRTLFPPNHLGADAFEHLQGLRCEVCHGDTRRHRTLMAGLADNEATLPSETGLTRLGDLPAATQLDICGRCHLQGDARLELINGPADRTRPLVAQIPALVPATPDDDFRFVSQLERLVLSPCFKESPALTCTTCHDPHQGVAAQGVARFERVCLGCHGDSAPGETMPHQVHASACNGPAGLDPMAVTGEPARTAQGCVDCHVRRSQPFDLPHVRSTDHWIRRRIPLPQDDIPHRAVADPSGSLRVFDLDRLPDDEATAHWRRGVMAVGLTTMGRTEEAATLFASYPAPGTPGATTAPPATGLEPLELQTSFHETRALSLLARGEIEDAQRAFDDALSLDPAAPGALLGRAQLHMGQGNVPGALRDSQDIIDTFPAAEHPWLLRLAMAERGGRTDLARVALRAIVRTWPADGTHWYKLGLLERQFGDEQAAQKALAHARRLKPSLLEGGASGAP